MAKYKCKVCGYVHEGNKAPDTCPVCSAPASEFEEIKEEGAAKKGINRDSNVYTVVYAAVMVVLVAVVLAFTSQSLRSFQKQNEDNDKRQQILRSINVNVSSSEAEAKYNELIKEAFLVNENGEKVEGDAFATDVVKAAAEHQYPVFVANVDGQPKYIMALHGAGLWGPLWGYISVDSDKNTIYGADFSHQGETPGLGAEISKPEVELYRAVARFKSHAAGVHYLVLGDVFVYYIAQALSTRFGSESQTALADGGYLFKQLFAEIIYTQRGQREIYIFLIGIIREGGEQLFYLSVIAGGKRGEGHLRSEEHTSELQSH